MGIWNFKKEQKREKHRFILAVDGGGMRGIIPAIILTKIDEMLKARGDMYPLYSHFDVIGGTSTGGLIALGLAAPADRLDIMETEEGEEMPIYGPEKRQTFMQKLRGEEPQRDIIATVPRGIKVDQLPGVYTENGSKIFPKPKSVIFGQIFTDKYDCHPLMSFLTDFYKDMKLSETNVPAVIVSYDVKAGEPLVLTTDDSHDFYMYEAARATSAAPTYFAPFITYDREMNIPRHLVDGSMYENTPIMSSYREAKRLYPDTDKFHILSLSTGTITFRLDASHTSGVTGWADPAKGAPIQKIYATSQMQMSLNAAESIDDIELTRVHGEYSEEKIKMDDVSPQSMEKLRMIAERIFEDNREQIGKFVDLMVRRDTWDNVRANWSHPQLENDN